MRTNVFRIKEEFFSEQNKNNRPNRGAVGCRSAADFKKDVDAMVTYMDLFTFVIMLCAVIALVYDITHKK